MKSPSRRWEGLALALLLIVALSLRFYRVGAQSLWNDEGTSVALAQRDLATIARDASHDIHPPLYYFLLHYWVRLAGTSEVGVRSLSALMGTGAVAAMYFLAKRRLGTTVALGAAWLTAISPYHIYYSQETRMYIGVTLAGLLSMLAYDGLLDVLSRARRFPWGLSLAYLTLTCAMVYMHYFAFTLLLAQGLGVLLWGVGQVRQGQPRSAPWWKALPWRIWGGWAALFALVLGAYFPWLRLSWPTLRYWPSVSAPFSLAELLARSMHLFPFGITVYPSAFSTAVGAAWVALTFWALISPLLGRSEHAPFTQALGQSALYWLVPLGAMYLASLRRPMYNPKFLLLASPGFYLLVAAGVEALGERFGRLTHAKRMVPLLTVCCLVTLGASVIPSLRNLYFNPAFARDDYRGIAAAINASAQPEDAILINAPSQIETVGYYYHGPLPLYPLPLQRPPDRAQTEQALEEIASRHGRIWAILWATNESDPQGIITNWLNQRCFQVFDRWYGNIRLALYTVAQPTENEERPVGAVFGGQIHLQSFALLTPAPSSGEVLQIRLTWEALRPIERRYKAFVHLLDGRGYIVGQHDSEPVAGTRLTTLWQVGETIQDPHGVLIMPGTPPGVHTVRVGLYSLEDGRRLEVTEGGSGLADAVDLATLTVRRAPQPPAIASLDIDAADDLSWGALRLLGHSLYPLGARHTPERHLAPGSAVELLLFWRKEAEGAGPSAWKVAFLDRKGRLAWEGAFSIAGGAYPPAAWEMGEIVRDIQHFFLPADLPPGVYQLALRPEGEGKWHRLGEVEIRR